MNGVDVDKDFTVFDFFLFMGRWKRLLLASIVVGLGLAGIYVQSQHYYSSVLNVEWQQTDAGVVTDSRQISKSLGAGLARFEMSKIFADAFVASLKQDVNEAAPWKKEAERAWANLQKKYPASPGTDPDASVSLGLAAYLNTALSRYLIAGTVKPDAPDGFYIDPGNGRIWSIRVNSPSNETSLAVFGAIVRGMQAMIPRYNTEQLALVKSLKNNRLKELNERYQAAQTEFRDARIAYTKALIPLKTQYFGILKQLEPFSKFKDFPASHQDPNKPIVLLNLENKQNYFEHLEVVELDNISKYLASVTSDAASNQKRVDLANKMIELSSQISTQRSLWESQRQNHDTALEAYKTAYIDAVAPVNTADLVLPSAEYGRSYLISQSKLPGFRQSVIKKRAFIIGPLMGLVVALMLAAALDLLKEMRTYGSSK